MKTIGIISCSNGLNKTQEFVIDKLESLLLSHNIKLYKSPNLYAKTSLYSGDGKERAESLLDLYKNPNISVICDVSGGDLANEILPHLNFSVIENNPKPFVGYSDLSVIINSIYSQTGQYSYLYQVRNVVSDDSQDLLLEFVNTVLYGKNDLLNFKYNWIQGSSMSGTLIGGNLRCTLKLAGTKFMPNFKDKILLIESLGGDISKISTYLTQYKLMGAFESVNGIILGQFTEMEKNLTKPSIEELIVSIVDNPDLPIIKTSNIGHSKDSRGVIIGKHLNIN